MDRSQWWFYAAIEDACLPPRPCYFSPTISFSLPLPSFIPLPFFPFSLPLAHAHASSLSFSRFLVLSRTRAYAHTTHRSPTVQFFASLSPYRFRFIASSPLLRSLVLSRPFVTNTATLYEQQKGPLLVKPSHTFSYTSRWFFQPRISDILTCTHEDTLQPNAVHTNFSSCFVRIERRASPILTSPISLITGRILIIE